MKENNFELDYQREGETLEDLFLRNYEELEKEGNHPSGHGTKMGMMELMRVDPQLQEFFEEGDFDTEVGERYLRHKLTEDEFQELSKQFIEFVKKKEDRLSQ